MKFVTFAFLTFLVVAAYSKPNTSESWVDFGKKVQNGTIRLSQRYSKDGVLIKVISTDRAEGTCKGEKKVSAEAAKQGQIEVSVKCDGKGWDTKQKSFKTNKKIEFGSLDEYPINKTSESLNAEKTIKFGKQGEMKAEIDEARSFGLILKLNGSEWEIVGVQYSSEDPG